MIKITIGRALPTLVTVVLLVLFVSLGFWQLQRASIKDQLQKLQQQHRATEPKAMQISALQLQDDSSWRERRVNLTGIFDARHQYLLDNRIYKSRAGFQVLTLFMTQGKSILVNRGWIALSADRNKVPLLNVQPGVVKVTGRLNVIGEQGPLLGSAGYESMHWPKIIQQIDIDKISAQVDIKPVRAVLELAAKNINCYVCDWPPQKGGMSADRHRAYALQWFSLALALLYLSLRHFYRNTKQ